MNSDVVVSEINKMAKRHFKERYRDNCEQNTGECINFDDFCRDFFTQTRPAQVSVEPPSSVNKLFETPDLHDAFFDNFDPYQSCLSFANINPSSDEAIHKLIDIAAVPRRFDASGVCENVKPSSALEFRRQNRVWGAEGFGSGSSRQIAAAVEDSESDDDPDEASEGATLITSDVHTLNGGDHDVIQNTVDIDTSMDAGGPQQFARIEIVPGSVTKENWKGAFSKITTRIMLRGVDSPETLFEAIEEVCQHVREGKCRLLHYVSI